MTIKITVPTVSLPIRRWTDMLLIWICKTIIKTPKYLRRFTIYTSFAIIWTKQKISIFVQSAKKAKGISVTVTWK